MIRSTLAEHEHMRLIGHYVPELSEQGKQSIRNVATVAFDGGSFFFGGKYTAGFRGVRAVSAAPRLTRVGNPSIRTSINVVQAPTNVRVTRVYRGTRELPNQSVRTVNDSPTLRPSSQIPTNANGHTQSNTQLGRSVHAEFARTHASGTTRLAEYRLPSGRRVDLIDFDARIIYEVKPHNSNGIRTGLRQLETYRIEVESIFGSGWRTILITY